MFLNEEASCSGQNRYLIELQYSQLRRIHSLNVSTSRQCAQRSGSFVWLSITFPECIGAYGTSAVVYVRHARLQTACSGHGVPADIQIFSHSLFFFPHYTDPVQAHSWQWYAFLRAKFPPTEWKQVQVQLQHGFNVELMTLLRGTVKSLLYTTC